MEELRQIAFAYYKDVPEHMKMWVQEFLSEIDKDGNEKVSLQEFLAYMGMHEDSKHLCTPSFFDELKQEGREELEFMDLLALFYIVSTGRPFCNGHCKNFIKGGYFTCVQCFYHSPKTFDLCPVCYLDGKYVHGHKNFLDNFLVLKTKRTDQKDIKHFRKRKMKLQSLIILSLALLLGISAEQCGRQAGNAVCPNGLCCSEYGWCGSTAAYCATGCQSQCASTPKPTPTPTPSGGGGDVSSVVSSAVFDQMLKYRNDARCKSNGFYKYDAFIAAARTFSGFGTTGDVTVRKRELAAFLAQTSHETTGGWATAPDGPYAWGYCFINENNQDVYCTPSAQYPCAAGKKYYGRGPIQLTHNYNYGQAGKAIGQDLIANPDLVATDPVVSFRTAIWFWMTPQGNKPSSHDVITGRWSPSAADTSAGRVPGYGVITNIINGGLECGHGQDDRVASRIGFYKRYSEILGVSPGDNLDCYNQRPFA